MHDYKLLFLSLNTILPLHFVNICFCFISNIILVLRKRTNCQKRLSMSEFLLVLQQFEPSNFLSKDALGQQEKLLRLKNRWKHKKCILYKYRERKRVYNIKRSKSNLINKTPLSLLLFSLIT